MCWARASGPTSGSRELVLADPAPFVPFFKTRRGHEIDYEAKTVMLAGRRYIVCRNLEQREKDAADRASIVAALERQLKKGDKSLEYRFLNAAPIGGFPRGGSDTIFSFGDFQTRRSGYGRASACDRSDVHGTGVG